MKNWSRVYGRTAAIIGALILGMIFPQAHCFDFLIPYLIIIMLFLSFIDISLSFRSFRASTFILLAANILIAFLGYFLLLPINRNLALVAFITGITPTATACPVIIGFLRGRVDYAVAGVLVTNIAVALILPFILPLVTGAEISVSSGEVLKTVVVLIFLPLGLSRFVRFLPQRIRGGINKLRSLTFPVWVAALFIISSKTANFIRNDSYTSVKEFINIAAVTLAVCVINFSAGALIGGKGLRREASQVLGQKNTTLTIWISLTFINPLVAMGPAFYVVFHNLYNSFQLYRHEKRKVLLPEETASS